MIEWIAISFFIVFYLSYFLIKQQRPFVFWSLFRLLIVILVVQLALSTFQVSMVPLYGAVILLLLLSLKTLKLQEDHSPIKKVRILIWALAISLTFSSVILQIL